MNDILGRAITGAFHENAMEIDKEFFSYLHPYYRWIKSNPLKQTMAKVPLVAPNSENQAW